MKILLSIGIILWVTLALNAQSVNPDKALKGKWSVDQKLLWQTDSAGPHMLGSIQNLLITAEGIMGVLDSKEAAVHLFSADGKHLVRFGKKGEGPGEFKTLNRGRQIFATDKQIIFTDDNRLLRFDYQGKFIAQTTLPTTLRPVDFLDAHHFLSAPGTSDQPNSTIPLEIFDCQKGERKILSTFKPYEKATASTNNGQQGITVGIIIGGITPLMTATAGRDRIVYGMSDRYLLTQIDLSGKAINSFSIPQRTAPAITAAYKEQLRKNLPGNAPDDLVKRILDGLPARAAFFSGLEIMENGIILSFVSEPDREDGFTIDIFSTEGKFLYQADFTAPAGHTIDRTAISQDRLFMASQDEEGTPMLSCYQITLPLS